VQHKFSILSWLEAVAVAEFMVLVEVVLVDSVPPQVYL
jgi:hypothetical protein